MTGLVGMLNILILGNGIIFDQVQSRELSDLQPNGKQSVFQVSFRDFFVVGLHIATCNPQVKG